MHTPRVSAGAYIVCFNDTLNPLRHNSVYAFFISVFIEQKIFFKYLLLNICLISHVFEMSQSDLREGLICFGRDGSHNCDRTSLKVNPFNRLIVFRRLVLRSIEGCFNFLHFEMLRFGERI